MATCIRVKKNAAYAAVCVAVLSGCASVGPQADWAPPAVGTSYETAQRNTGSYGKDVQFKVTRGTSTFNGAPVLTMVNSLGGTVVQRPSDGKWITVLGPNGKPAMSFDPPIGWEWPLKVGKTFTTRHRLTTHATGTTVDYEYACNVEDFEKVTVRAGTFDAFRVQCKNNLEGVETFWYSQGTAAFIKTKALRSAKHPAGPGTQETELVTAPK
jgi:hypothetical protein